MHASSRVCFVRCSRILASFFETTGLANVEAAYLGASVVGTNQGYCREIFGKYANYCDPFNKESILKATIEAWNTKQLPDTKNWISHRFCYKICALKHANFYEKMPLVVIVGAEDKGISLLTQKKCDYLLSIPLKGKTSSLNASVAAAISLFHLTSK